MSTSYCSQRVIACSNPTKQMKEIATKKLGSIIPNMSSTIEAAMKRQKIDNDKDVNHDGDLLLCELLATCNLSPHLIEQDSFKRYVKYLQA